MIWPHGRATTSSSMKQAHEDAIDPQHKKTAPLNALHGFIRRQTGHVYVRTGTLRADTP